MYFLNQVHAGRRLAHAFGFLKLLLSVKLACMCACVCVPAPEVINYFHVILNLYNQLNKFVAFRDATKLSTHVCGLCNKHDVTETKVIRLC